MGKWGNCGNKALFGQRAAEIRVCVDFLHSEHCVFIAVFDKTVHVCVCVCVLGRVLFYVRVDSIKGISVATSENERERAILHSFY